MLLTSGASGGSPGSSIQDARSVSAPFRTFPRRSAEWLIAEELSTYSGGTAPVSHRLPFYALAGTRGDGWIVKERFAAT